MAMFTRKTEPAPAPLETPRPAVVPDQPNRSSAPAPTGGGVLSTGVSIKGNLKSSGELLIDGEVEGKIDSTGVLTIGEHAQIKGEIKAKSVKVRGTVKANIVASERCELAAGCTLHGDVEAPRLVVNENATFLGSAKVAMSPQK
jgi:cytoskeletal protein CcmA (bactofilin family)